MDKPKLPMKPIPQEWIRDYVEQLYKAAESFGDTPMGRAAVERGLHIMDMVEAFRESEKRRSVRDAT